MKKRIILGLPAVYGIGELLKENLQYMGFEVIDLSFDYKSFAYKNSWQRATNFFRKVFLRDKSYKDKLRFAAHQQLIMDKVSKLTCSVDYALIIRPDTYSKDVLQLIKSKSVFFVGYQWDGMSRYPWIEKYVPLFDRFFVFDPADVSRPSLSCHYLGNFYFTLPRICEAPAGTGGGAYFIGAFNRERLGVLTKLHAALAETGVSVDFRLYSKKRRKINIDQPGISLTTAVCTYEQNLESARNALVLIDITAPCHKGLSLRFFESVCYRKKLITTNQTVRQYDFYHRDNIFVYGEEDLSELPAFMARPYRTVDEKISRKYGFDNWIRYALDLPPYIAMGLT